MQTTTQSEFSARPGLFGFASAEPVAMPNPNLSTVSSPRFQSFDDLDFQSNNGMQIDEAKALARASTLRTSESERQALLDERKTLLDLELSGVITRKEANRLAYVRWSLDQIEDAKNGHTLDTLDAVVSQYENFLEKIEKLNRNLLNATKRRR